jgi:hypothetical protein
MLASDTDAPPQKFDDRITLTLFVDAKFTPDI